MNVLEEANRLVHGDRDEAYGHPFDFFSRVAAMWSAMLGVQVTAEQVGLLMGAFKLARQCHKLGVDNLIDLAGYAETVNMVIEERARRAKP